MKRIIALICLIYLLVSCSSKHPQMTVSIENPSNFDRSSELVEIPLDDIKDKVKLTDTLAYIVEDKDGNIIPSQITYDRKLIFQPSLKASETKDFVITIGEKQSYEPKTYARFITERKDDFAWENDRVAFRVYGPALIAIDGPSNGIDIWYKKTNALVIDKWYKDDLAGVASYHDDHGEGLDDYKVGRSLGAGAMAPYTNDKLWLNENFLTQEIMDNGPLRTTVKLTYKDINVNGSTFSESRTISLDAGSQFSKVIQAYGIKEPLAVAAGFVKRQNDSIVAADNYIVYAEPMSEKAGEVFLGMVFPNGMDKTTIDTYEVENPNTKQKSSFSHVLGVTTQQPNIPVTYYTGYGWSKFGFSTLNDYINYVKNFTESLKQPLIIKYQ